MTRTATSTGVPRRHRLLLVGLAVALFIAGVVSWYASASPDGLERVATDEGFADTAQAHALAGSPLADYTVSGVADDRLAAGLAGVAGVLATLLLGGALFVLVRRRGTRAR